MSSSVQKLALRQRIENSILLDFPDEQRMWELAKDATEVE